MKKNTCSNLLNVVYLVYIIQRHRIFMKFDKFFMSLKREDISRYEKETRGK